MDIHEELKSMYVKLVDNLNCSICHDSLVEARDLSCGHTYCLACIQELVAIKGWTKTIECCLCKRHSVIPASGLSGLKQNYKLNCIIDEQRQIMKLLAKEKTTTKTKAANKEEKVQIFVKNPDGKTLVYEVRLSDTARALALQISQKTGIPEELQLVFRSKNLSDNRMLKEYKIEKNCTIFALFRGVGGSNGRYILKPNTFM